MNFHALRTSWTFCFCFVLVAIVCNDIQLRDTEPEFVLRRIWRPWQHVIFAFVTFSWHFLSLIHHLCDLVIKWSLESLFLISDRNESFNLCIYIFIYLYIYIFLNCVVIVIINRDGTMMITETSLAFFSAIFAHILRSLYSALLNDKFFKHAVLILCVDW